MTKYYRTTFRNTIIAALVSVLIGIVLMWISTKTFNHTLLHYFWNAGYSLCIGLSLFSNATVFTYVERRYISWIDHPTRSILIAIFFHLTYSTIVIFIFNWLWFVILSDHTVSSFIKQEWLIILGQYIILIIITSILYANSFFKVWRHEAIQNERLKQEAIALQYQVMQNQVNPHFLFNSLNVLGNLIDIDPPRAKEYTIQLAGFYRSLLQLKDQEIIALHREIDFVKRYVYLQKIRFGEGFHVEINLNDGISGELIPLSLQMLIENAVKHNEISKEHPLWVSIGYNMNNSIFVENNINPKMDKEHSNNIGLVNLKERYLYLTGSDVIISNENDKFRVTLPLIKIEP
jgi:two-component system, LytTR family, sensor kinase